MLAIGEVAALAGISVDAVRYYEREGLLPEPLRDVGGRRRYEASIIDALDLIGALRRAGFGVADIRSVMSLKGLSDVADRMRGVLEVCDRLTGVLDEREDAIRVARETLAIMRAEAAQHLEQDPRSVC